MSQVGSGVVPGVRSGAGGASCGVNTVVGPDGVIVMGGAGSPWALIHGERKALLDDLEGVGAAPGVWGTRSLCTEWDVHQVLGHMLSTAMMTPPRFIGEMARAGFRFPKFADAGVAAWTKATPQETIAAFRAVQDRTTSPPGPVDAMLGEAVVHPEDIRRPLGLRRVYPGRRWCGPRTSSRGRTC